MVDPLFPRRHDRVITALRVDVDVAGGAKLAGTIVNASREGMYIECTGAPPRSTRVTVSLIDGGAPLTMGARARRSDVQGMASRAAAPTAPRWVACVERLCAAAAPTALQRFVAPPDDVGARAARQLIAGAKENDVILALALPSHMLSSKDAIAKHVASLRALLDEQL